jgi:hypothetical protein
MSRLMLVLTAAAIAFATPASAKVLTVCGGLPGLEAEAPEARPFAAFAYAGSGVLVRPARIALTEDAAGYDIHLNWGETNERSLRDAGAQILSMGLDVGIVHLMVARSEASPVEHYLFQLDIAGRGELLSGQDSDDLEGGLARFSCNAP